MQFEKREMKMRRAGKAGRAAVFCLCAGLVLGDPVKGFAWEQTEYVRRATGSNALGRPLLMAEIERDFPATVREVVLAGMQRSGRRFPFYTREDRKKAADAMETLDITDLADYRIGNLSGGQKQRVLLARALCREPKLLILDEPCAGLDPAITAEFYSLIDHINKKQGVTILMVSHDLDQVEQYASHIIMMNQTVEFDGDHEAWCRKCAQEGGHYHDTVN